MASTAPDRNALLTSLHTGLRTRQAPQDVARALVALGVGKDLSPAASTDLHTLAGPSGRRHTQPMPDTFRRHPGLHRAYQVANTLMGQVTATVGGEPLPQADPSDPASLDAWLTSAHHILGLDPATARPARATAHNRQFTQTYAYARDGWTGAGYGADLDVDGPFAGLINFVTFGEVIPLEEIDFDFPDYPGDTLTVTDDSTPEPTPETPASDPDAQLETAAPASAPVTPAPTPMSGTGPDEMYTCTYTRRPRGRRGDKGGHGDARVRYDAADRHDKLPGVSVRTYRKAVRAVLHLAQRTQVLAGERDREAAIAYGKSRLAYTIALEAFTASEPVATFVAYYTARLGMRTLFTSGAQVRPMDTLAEELLGRALAAPDCRHDVLARVLTRRAVLSHLDDHAKGELFGLTHAHLVAAARTLRGIWDPNRRDMVVRLGDDSSSWNIASRAFNQARTGILNLAGELGLEPMLEQSCPGKVPALIAADVARWHTLDGGGREHLDVDVFNELPKPWDVVLDGAPCPLELIREVCTTRGLDPDTSGWTTAYRQSALEVPAPAPALVHGCVVASPELARQLRAAGWFSGQV